MSDLPSLALAAVVASLASLAGCASPEKTPIVVQCTTPVAPDRAGPALVGQAYGMAMTALPLNSVQFSAGDVARSLAVQNLYASRTLTNTVEISARFVSCLDSPSTILVRTSFLRANSAPAEPASAWKSVYLQPRGTAVYSESSVSLDAASYLIEVTK
jgi:hypothetical protein